MQPPEAESGREALPGVTVTVPEERAPGPGAASPPYRTGQGSRFPLGASAHAEGVNFCVFSRHATRVDAAALRGRRQPRAVPDHRARARAQPHLLLLARLRRRAPGRRPLRVAHGRPDRHARDGPLLRPAQGSRRPVRAGGDGRRMGPAQGSRSATTTVTPASAAIVAEGLPARPVDARRARRRRHLRAARGRLHAPPLERRAAPRHLRGPGREDPLPARPRRHARRAAAGDGVRRAGRTCPASLRRGLTELLGLQHPQLLQPAPALLREPGERRPRVPRPHRRAPRGRASACCSTSCSTTPPRAAQGGPVIHFKGHGQRGVLSPRSRRPAPLPRLHRLRQHGQLQPPDRHGLMPCTASSTGWRSSASTGSASTWRASSPAARTARSMAEPAAALGHRVVARPLPRAADRRGLGRGRPLSRRRVPRAWRWAEWNGRYRDAVRRFVRGDPGLVGEVATRIAGSADLYGDDGRLPANSVNFVTCHDGFTLADLVSYNDEAQRGQRRGQPRRGRRQRELELRRRGRDLGPGGDRAPAAGRRGTTWPS